MNAILMTYRCRYMFISTSILLALAGCVHYERGHDTAKLCKAENTGGWEISDGGFASLAVDNVRYSVWVNETGYPYSGTSLPQDWLLKEYYWLHINWRIDEAINATSPTSAFYYPDEAVLTVGMQKYKPISRVWITNRDYFDKWPRDKTTERETPIDLMEFKRMPQQSSIDIVFPIRPTYRAYENYVVYLGTLKLNDQIIALPTLRSCFKRKESTVIPIPIFLLHTSKPE